MSAVLHFDEQRSDPGELASLVLAVLVHVLLALILVFGVRWQNRPPESVSVELWEAPRAAPPPPVVVEPPKPAPRVEPAPPPPAPEPKPAPRIEKPDIVVKAPPPPKPKPEVKPPPKPEPPKAVVKPKPEPPKAVAKPKPEPVKAPPAPPKPPSDAAAQKRLREELAREQMALASGRERDQIADMLKRDAAAASAAASSKSLAGWIDKVRAKIRGNILLPVDMKGNPEAIFDVVQLPTGEVLTAKLRKSSGNAAYDAAVERAILKSSPLPRPDRPDQFRRDLELKFRPHDPI